MLEDNSLHDCLRTVPSLDELTLEWVSGISTHTIRMLDIASPLPPAPLLPNMQTFCLNTTILTDFVDLHNMASSGWNQISTGQHQVTQLQEGLQDG